MKREEEYKRLSEALAEDDTYNAVGFTYSSDYYDPSEPTEEEEQPSRGKVSTMKIENLEENEEPFIAPLGLNVPSDVELPPTAKMHAIIERTANFVCKQGAQFEIMLKAKQARNSQFDFLRFDHYLNPYYKFIQKAIKEGRYATAAQKKKDEKKNVNEDADKDDADEDDADGDNYLHPSLFASKKHNRLEELMKPLKVVDPDHPLAVLVRKTQAENNLAAPQSAEGAAVPPSQIDYSSDSTVAAMYYSYYMLPDGSYCLAPPPPGIDMATYYSALPAGVTVSSTTGVATITAPPPPGTITPQSSEAADESRGGISATTSSTSTIPPVVAIIPPPPDIQPVIDKLAEYVARNGIKFETSVRAKNDPRFEFLQPWHQYNAYYEFKKQFFLQKEDSDSSKHVASLSEDIPVNTASDVPGETQFSTDQTSEDMESVSQGSKKDPNIIKLGNDGKLVKASFAPISFAIRVKENDLLPLEKNRVKLDDDSDEEGEEGKEGQENASSTSNTGVAFASSSNAPEERKPQLTQEELEAKQAKQKLEDRLAAAAREKLAQASKESKEKQLQAERKRKAALFLQNLKNPLADADVEKMEENAFNIETISNIPCSLLTSIKTLPALEAKMAESPLSRSRDLPREEEKEKKKKKHKKRSRSRSRSPLSKYHSSSKSRSRSHSKAKHSLPTAYRTVRHSRSRSRSPRRRAHTPERRREERSVPTAYRVTNSPGMSRRRTRSRSPSERKKRRSHSHSKSKARSHSPSISPSKQLVYKNSTHSASVSPVESRGSSQERAGGASLEKEGQISSAIVSSVQSKITQDLMAKVRAMLAASKNIPTSAS
nr:splicing factor, suppressor of white-apricot homolog isoform X2 [Anolis sagrei ordinatus]